MQSSLKFHLIGKFSEKSYNSLIQDIRLDPNIRRVTGTITQTAFILEIHPAEGAKVDEDYCHKLINDKFNPDDIELAVKFKVEMHCESCKSSVIALLEDKVDDLSVSLLDQEVSLSCREGSSMREIYNLLRENFNDVTPIHRLRVEYLNPGRTKTFYYTIGNSGATADTDWDLLKSSLEIKVPEIDHCTVNPTTNMLVVRCLENSATQDQEGASKIGFDREFNNKIQRALLQINDEHGKKFSLTSACSIYQNDSRNKSTRKYFENGAVNAIFGLIIVLVGMFAPTAMTTIGQWIGLFIGGVTLNVMWHTGEKIYSAAWVNFVRYRQPDMNTLIALGTGTAWLYSMLLCLLPSYFPAAALQQFHFLAVSMILGIVNFGKGVRVLAENHARMQLRALQDSYIELQPQKVKKRLPNKKVIEVDLDDVKQGDVLVIEAGKRVPVDCTIISKDYLVTIGQDVLTGESKTQKKTQEKILAGGMVERITNRQKTKTYPQMFVISDCRGNNSSLNKILTKVSTVANFGAGDKQSSIDKIARYFVPTIIAIAVLSGGVWLVLGPQPALPWMLQSMMSVLLCACPCALGLAAPIAMRISIYKMLDHKILVRNSAAIEKLAKIHTFVFDKTGTLTMPMMTEQDFCLEAVEDDLSAFAPQDVLRYVASLERKFEHPIANVLHHLGTTEELETFQCDNHKEISGGVTGEVNGHTLILGNQFAMDAHKISYEPIQKAFVRNEKNGLTSIFIAIDGRCVGILGLKHKVRPDAKAAIKYLRECKKDIFICTGDNQASAEKVALELGITPDSIKYHQSPQDKKEFIQKLKANNRTVAMVGDGINDIPCSKEATVSIAVGAWTHASGTADLVVQSFNFKELLTIAQETVRTIEQNLWWTLAYNLVSIVAASGLLYPLYGIILNPVLASMAMAFSSIFVVFNSSLLEAKVDQAVAAARKLNDNDTVLSSALKQVKAYGRVLGALFVHSLHKPAQYNAENEGGNTENPDLSTTPDQDAFSDDIGRVTNSQSPDKPYDFTRPTASLHFQANEDRPIPQPPTVHSPPTSPDRNRQYA